MCDCESESVSACRLLRSTRDVLFKNRKGRSRKREKGG